MMSKTAQDYPVTFDYNKKADLDGNGTYEYTHKGRDRSMVTGVKLVIGDTTLGLTGNTGKSTGSHLHTQAGWDFYAQNHINPKGHEFKTGRVVAIRTTDTGGWGRYVIVRNNNGVYVVYAHLHKVYVKVGDIIKEENMVSKTMAGVIVRAYSGRTITAAEIKKYVGKETADQFRNRVRKWGSAQNAVKRAKNGTLVPQNHVMYSLRRYYKDPKVETIKSLEANVKSLKTTVDKLKADDVKDESIKKTLQTEIDLLMEQLNEEKKSTKIDIGSDTRNWFERIISVFRKGE